MAVTATGCGCKCQLWQWTGISLRVSGMKAGCEYNWSTPLMIIVSMSQLRTPDHLFRTAHLSEIRTVLSISNLITNAVWKITNKKIAIAGSGSSTISYFPHPCPSFPAFPYWLLWPCGDFDFKLSLSLTVQHADNSKDELMLSICSFLTKVKLYSIKRKNSEVTPLFDAT